MRGVFALVTIVLSLGPVHVWAAPDCLEHRPVVTVQIHDYEHLPPESLSRASDIVTRVYQDIGVGTEWIGVIRQDVHRTNSPTPRSGPRVPIAQITVIILTPEMAARGHIAEDVLGFAAVPTEGMGRIAYAIYKRIEQNASQDGTSEVDLLGFVMAHEIGHLLLGRGAGSAAGVMKDHWDRRDLQRLDPRQLAFSEREAGQIRRTIQSDSWPPPGAVATSGSKADDSCVIPSRDEHAAEDPH